MKNHVLSAIFLISIFATECASSTVIRTTDPDAKIYVDEEYLGKGSVTHTDSRILGSTIQIRIQKEGCSPAQFVITKDEEVKIGPLLGTFCVGFPVLWSLGYKPVHSYEYSCKLSDSTVFN